MTNWIQAAKERKALRQALKEQYPKGTRIALVRMDDPQAPPAGTAGTVLGVDELCDLLVRWDNGSSLNVIYGEDEVRKI